MKVCVRRVEAGTGSKVRPGSHCTEQSSIRVSQIECWATRRAFVRKGTRPLSPSSMPSLGLPRSACGSCRRSLLALAVFRNVASGNSQRSLGEQGLFEAFWRLLGRCVSATETWPMFTNVASTLHVSRGLIGIHMASIEERAARAAKIASVLRLLGNGVLSRQQAERAAQLLGVHCTTVYRLRRRFLADPVASTLEPRQPGRATGGRLHHGGRGSGSIRQPTTVGCTTACSRLFRNRFSPELRISTPRCGRYHVIDAHRLG